MMLVTSDLPERKMLYLMFTAPLNPYTRKKYKDFHFVWTYEIHRASRLPEKEAYDFIEWYLNTYATVHGTLISTMECEPIRGMIAGCEFGF